jgi:hypothetical protein
MDELDACWFSADEYADIARLCRKEIKMVERRGSARKKFSEENEHRYCPRGLESHTHLAILARNQNRRAAWSAVLDEQSDQSSLGVIDDEAIASRYRDASRSSQLSAIHVGQQDERLAELVYDDMLD